MAIPEYCDERARKFFHRGYVGDKHGEDGTAYKWSWSSDDLRLRPTTVHEVNGLYCYCVYCGNRAFPIQSGIKNHSNYDVVGHACVCKDAMDELDWVDKYEILLAEQEQARSLLMKEAPKPSPEVLAACINKRVDYLKKDIETGHLSNSVLKTLGIHRGSLTSRYKD